MKFTPLNKFPKFEEKDGNLKTKPLLGLSKENGYGIVVAFKTDDVITWKTQCENEYDVTDYLIGWQYLPKAELRKV